MFLTLRHAAVPKRISEVSLWEDIMSDEYGDGFGMRHSQFENFLLLGGKQNDKSIGVFATYSMGVKTNRDDWVYNYSKARLHSKTIEMIDFYNSEADRYCASSEMIPDVENFVSWDKSKIKWTPDLLRDLKRAMRHKLDVSDAAFI